MNLRHPTTISGLFFGEEKGFGTGFGNPAIFYRLTIGQNSLESSLESESNQLIINEKGPKFGPFYIQFELITGFQHQHQLLSA